MTKTVLAFAASNSASSINRKLVEHAARTFKADFMPDVVIETLDLNDYEMPIYSQAREQESGIPAKAQAFYDKIGKADGLMIAFAEHNGSYAAAYKNIFDWMSRIKMAVYQNKPTAFFATSPGPRGGQKVLEFAVMTAPFFGAKVVGSQSIAGFGERFDDATGGLTHDDDVEAMNAALRAMGEAMSADVEPLSAAA